MAPIHYDTEAEYLKAYTLITSQWLQILYNWSHDAENPHTKTQFFCLFEMLYDFLYENINLIAQ